MDILNKSPCEGSISINTRRRRRRTQMFALRKLRQILFYDVSKQNKQLLREDSGGDVFFSLSHSLSLGVLIDNIGRSWSTVVVIDARLVRERNLHSIIQREEKTWGNHAQSRHCPLHLAVERTGASRSRTIHCLVDVDSDMTMNAHTDKEMFDDAYLTDELVAILIVDGRTLLFEFLSTHARAR